MTQKKNKVCDFLKEKRVQAGLSQVDVAKALGYSTAQFISNWERNTSAVPIAVIKKLADVYNTSAEEIFEMTLRERVEEIERELRGRFAR